MRTIETVPEMQAWADATRQAGLRIGFVPTMGYLHEGHLSLVREARRRSDRCVVSIFVNPLQFGPGEDLDRYPRDLARDRAALSAEGAGVLFLPRADEIYPQGFQTEVCVAEVTQGLCGAARPGHFNGVTTVVAKLFNAVKPHVAVFGEKDFQQLVTIRRMVADLDFDIDIVGAPIVREADGVAMSSRNAYLSPREREAARVLSRCLAAARSLVDSGVREAAAVRGRVDRELKSEPLARVDYVALVDPATMAPIGDIAGPTLLALAVFIGKTRLIDNTILAAGLGPTEHPFPSRRTAEVLKAEI